ncbi:hypothetical protein [Ancylobacter sp. IITR112]|uniref:DUF6925 family protein n=1 Tax=Ancylobacter sp. IITR112 TaxID=3138073 RepID=UPI00352B12E3
MDGTETSCTPDAVFAWLAEVVADPDCTLSLGAFGAIGQFPCEPRIFVDVSDDRIKAETATAAIDLILSKTMRPLAFETISSDPQGWNQGIALCLPEVSARMSGRTIFTAIGPDVDAFEASQRNLQCYDFGFGTRYADVCVRTLAGSGECVSPRPGMAGELADFMQQFRHDTWIFKTALGRIETRYSERWHVIPSLLSGSATHSNAIPIPAGFIPVAYVFPPTSRSVGTTNAMAHHRSFQQLIDRYGDRSLARFKREVEGMLDLSLPPDALDTLLGHKRSPTRAEIACIRIALRQRRWRRGECDRPNWERAFDRPLSQQSTPTSIPT